MANKQGKPALPTKAELKKWVQDLSTTRTKTKRLLVLYDKLTEEYKQKFSPLFMRHPNTPKALRELIFDYWIQDYYFDTELDCHTVFGLATGKLTRKMIDDAIASIFTAVIVPPRFTKRKMNYLVSIIKNPATTGSQLKEIYDKGLEAPGQIEAWIASIHSEILENENGAISQFLLNSSAGKEIFGNAQNARDLEDRVRKFHKKIGIKKWDYDDDNDEGIDWVTFSDVWRWMIQWHRSQQKDFDIRHPAEAEIREYIAIFESAILPALARNGKNKLIREQLIDFGFWGGKPLLDTPKYRKLVKGKQEARKGTDWSGDCLVGSQIGSPWMKQQIKNRQDVRFALAMNPSLPKRDLMKLADDDCVGIALVARSQLKKRFK